MVERVECCSRNSAAELSADCQGAVGYLSLCSRVLHPQPVENPSLVQSEREIRRIGHQLGVDLDPLGAAVFVVLEPPPVRNHDPPRHAQNGTSSAVTSSTIWSYLSAGIAFVDSTPVTPLTMSRSTGSGISCFDAIANSRFRCSSVITFTFAAGGAGWGCALLPSSSSSDATPNTADHAYRLAYVIAAPSCCMFGFATISCMSACSCSPDAP